MTLAEEKQLAYIMIGAFLLAEMHSIIYWIDDSINEIKYNLFLRAGFKMELTVEWWLKAIFDDFLPFLLLTVFARVCHEKELKLLLKVTVIWIFYMMANVFLTMYDFKQPEGVVPALTFFSIISAIVTITAKPKLKIVR